MKNKTENIDFYNLYKKTYGENVGDENKVVYNKILKLFLKNSNSKKHNFLDIGCGKASFLYYLFKNKFPFEINKLVGFDFRSEEFFSQKDNKDIFIFKDDFFKIKKKIDIKFDNILLFDVLEHLNTKEAIEILKCVKSISKKDAIILIHVPNGNSPFSNSIRYSDITHQKSYTTYSLKQLIYMSGLNPKKIEFISDSPIIHGLKSLIRFLFWKIIEFCLMCIDIFETGSGRFPYTRNIYCLIKI